MDAGRLVTEEQIAQYQSDGAVLLRNVFSQQWVDLVREGIEINLKSPSQFGEWLKVYTETITIPMLTCII